MPSTPAGQNRTGFSSIKLRISTPTRYRAAPFLRPHTAITVENPPKPCSRGPTPPALPREREPDLHQHRRREAPTSSKQSKTQIRSIGLHRHRETAARLDLALPSNFTLAPSPPGHRRDPLTRRRPEACCTPGHLPGTDILAPPPPWLIQRRRRRHCWRSTCSHLPEVLLARIRQTPSSCPRCASNHTARQRATIPSAVASTTGAGPPDTMRDTQPRRRPRRDLRPHHQHAPPTPAARSTSMPMQFHPMGPRPTQHPPPPDPAGASSNPLSNTTEKTGCTTGACGANAWNPAAS